MLKVTGKLKPIPTDWEAGYTFDRSPIYHMANTDTGSHTVASWPNLHVFKLCEKTRVNPKKTHTGTGKGPQSAANFKLLLWGNSANSIIQTLSEPFSQSLIDPNQ